MRLEHEYFDQLSYLHSDNCKKRKRSTEEENQENVVHIRETFFTKMKMIVMVLLLKPCRWGTNSSAATTGLCMLRDIHVGIRPTFQSRLHLHTPPVKDACVQLFL